MYDIKPSRIFVSDRVLEHPEALARFKRFMQATGSTDYEVVEDNKIPWMLQQPEWSYCKTAFGARSEQDQAAAPVFFFNTLRFDDKMSERIDEAAALNPDVDREIFNRYHHWGYRHMVWFNSAQDPKDVKPKSQHICRPCWRLNISPGCTHECLYCYLAGHMTVGLNMEEYLQELQGVIDETPWQLTYLSDDASDLLILEPELGLVKDLCEFFAKQNDPERYFIMHTKSANVDFLRDVDHRGHTIMCWSLAGRTQSLEMEAGSGTMEERIEAAVKCQEWGMPVRFKFKPIIPVRGWRDEAREMIKLMFEKTRPDNLSMTVLLWMQFQYLEKAFDLDQLDPKFVDAARRYDDQLGGERLPTCPFPPEVRCEIYEFFLKEIRAIDSDVPVTISTESAEVWKHMQPILGVDIGTYVCGCGPCSTPGLKTLPENAWELARSQLPKRVREGNCIQSEE